MGIQFEKLKKLNFRRPIHTGKTGSGKGKQRIILGWPQVKICSLVDFLLKLYNLNKSLLIE